jgi:class 3 adenylate cyclase
MQIPDTEFAHCGDIQIAYQVYGSGTVEVVICGGPAGHVDAYWDEPLAHRWYERIGTFARVATFDRRGTGASDAASAPPTDYQYMDDLKAVIDSCGFQRPALIGAVEASRMCALFAANYPERVSSLVLIDTAAAGRDVLGEEQVEWLTQVIEDRWGKGEITALYAPSMADNESFRRWIGRMERLAVSPRGARQILDGALESDVTEALPMITCPTLVLHHRENTLVPAQLGRDVATRIADARFVEVAGRDSMAWLGDANAILGEIEEFLTGSRTAHAGNQLAAILFTDIVGSTELATRLHHEQWGQLLREHDQLVRREIELAGGIVVNTTGDGFLATFDTPDQAICAARGAIQAARALSMQVRAGVHVGTIERLPDDVHGIAVHIAARIRDLATAGQVLVSSTVKDILVDTGVPLDVARTTRLRGVPDSWTLYELTHQPIAQDESDAALEPTRVTTARTTPCET